MPNDTYKNSNANVQENKLKQDCVNPWWKKPKSRLAMQQVYNLPAHYLWPSDNWLLRTIQRQLLFIYLKESRIIKSKYSNTSSYWIFMRKINK